MTPWNAFAHSVEQNSSFSHASIAELWRAAMWGKKAGSGLDDPAFLQPQRPMSAIGG